MKPVLSLKEAAAILNMSETTLRVWCQSGQLRASKLGRSWKIQESALQDLLDEYQHRPSSKLESGRPIRIPLLSERPRRRAKRADK